MTTKSEEEELMRRKLKISFDLSAGEEEVVEDMVRLATSLRSGEIDHGMGELSFIPSFGVR